MDLKCHSEWRTPNALWELVTALGKFRMLCLEALGVFGAPMADETVRNAYVQKRGWIFYIVLQCRAFASELIRNPFRPSPPLPFLSSDPILFQKPVNGFNWISYLDVNFDYPNAITRLTVDRASAYGAPTCVFKMNTSIGFLV